MNAAAVDQVEQRLRQHVRQARGLRAFHYRALVNPEQFWPDAAALAVVEARDEAGECQRVSVEAAERHGLGIVVGWVLDDRERPCWHCANVSPTGELVDAGRARHLPGMLGKVLTPSEGAMVARAAGQRTGRELQDAFASLGERGSGLLDALGGRR